ncbi:MAG TPA: hypothetical protein VFV67_06280 [Actinophytocola sp.]|uniref:hypothetical protein n=1 Tax=Actinophytocola sp. TaxID=1872138 RepID=UPI002DB71D3D|nr:hypothetical protein [Actinophytocola sp.]HEU5470241.1 hypothetical protein [Actinophytocola sp.]
MSTRTRSRSSGRSYTARLHDRAVAARRTSRPPAWLASPYPPALLALGAELGHLAAALVEWPAAPVRGLVHVLAAAVFGLIAVSVYFGPGRIAVVAGIAAGLMLPVAWPAGALAGVPLYLNFPLWAVVPLVVIETALAGLLILRTRSQRRSVADGGSPKR